MIYGFLIPFILLIILIISPILPNLGKISKERDEKLFKELFPFGINSTTIKYYKYILTKEKKHSDIEIESARKKLGYSFRIIIIFFSIQIVWVFVYGIYVIFSKI